MIEIPRSTTDGIGGFPSVEKLCIYEDFYVFDEEMEISACIGKCVDEKWMIPVDTYFPGQIDRRKPCP